MRAPEGFMREAAKRNIENYARENSISSISLDSAEKGLEIARELMQQQVEQGEKPSPKASKCPFASTDDNTDASSGNKP